MLVLGLITESQANTLVTQSAAPNVTVRYCTGGEQRQSLNEAKKCDYLSLADSRTAMQTHVVRWVKVDISTNSPTQVLTINVGPHILRAIEIFDGKTDALVAGPVGMAYPYSPEHGLLVGYTFSINPDAVGKHTYYVRIVTAALPYAFVQATLDPVTAVTMSQQIGLGVHLGVLGLLVLIAGGLFMVTRTPIMLVFTLVILNLLLSILAGSGFLFQHLWPDSPRFNSLFFNTMSYLRPGLWLWLARTFLAPYQTPSWYGPSCRTAYAIVAVMVLFAWFGLEQISNLLVLVFAAFIFPIVQIIAIWKTVNIRPVYQRILMSGYAIGGIGAWVGLIFVIFPTDDPLLPIQVSRIIDYANPVVLLGLVMFHYRETVLQLAETREENVAIKLGLKLEQQLLHERKLMIDMLTHELKNPLASISLASGSLAASIKNDDSLTMRRLHNIQLSVRSMDAVIERCNIMNQLDQSALTPSLSTIGLNEMLSNILDGLTDGHRVTVNIEGAEKAVTDPQFFRMIMSNLIDNALRYSRTDSRVNVMIQRDSTSSGKQLVIEVVNQVGSKGLPDDRMVFTRFYRHELAHRTSGSGVGLYLTKALVTLMGGHIDYRSSDGQVIFRVTLPEASNNA